MHLTGIYEIRNLVNGKRYIGSAVDFGNRWRQHAQSLTRGDHHSKPLQRAWNRYGACAFQFNKLLACSKDNLIVYEQACIDGYRPEYNVAPKAGSQLGFKHSQESREKMRASRLAYDFKPWLGKMRSEETKAKISATKTGVNFGKYDDGRVARAAAGMRASKKSLSDEQVRLIRQWNSEGRPHRYAVEKLGCTYWVVADAASGRTFKWVK